MQKTFLLFAMTFLLTIATLLSAQAQSLSNLHIGDEVTRLATLGEPAATDKYKSYLVRKWRFANGNELSITTDATGRIVYLESDWGGHLDGNESDLRGLTFGATTLSELRVRFGSNGLTFKGRAGVIGIQNGVVMMNSYEVGSNIVTFITKVSDGDSSPSTESGKSSAIADRARLDAISIADAGYAQSEWGDRVYDPNYQRIEWK